MPLVCRIDWQTEEIVMSLMQPLSVEVIPQLNAHSTRYDGPVSFEYYDVRAGCFVPVDDINAHRMPFPPAQIPVFRVQGAVPLLSNQNANLGSDIARGERKLRPMCSMKHMFMEYRFIWPCGLLWPREYLSARWTATAWGGLADCVQDENHTPQIIQAPL